MQISDTGVVNGFVGNSNCFYSSCNQSCVTPTWKVGWLRSQNAMVYEQEPPNAAVCREMLRLLNSSILSMALSCTALLNTLSLDLAAVRLVRGPAVALLECGRSLQLVTALAESRAGDTLVGVRRLLDDGLLMTAGAGAAAHAEQPEEARCNAEGDAEPHDLQHLVAHGGFDFVVLERGLEDAGQDAVDAGCGRCGGDGEDGRCLGGVSLYWKSVS